MAPSQKTTVTSLGEHLPQESTGTPTHATLHPSPKSHPTPSRSRLSAEAIKTLFFCFVFRVDPPLSPCPHWVLVENGHLWETTFAPKSTST